METLYLKKYHTAATTTFRTCDSICHEVLRGKTKTWISTFFLVGPTGFSTGGPRIIDDNNEIGDAGGVGRAQISLATGTYEAVTYSIRIYRIIINKTHLELLQEECKVALARAALRMRQVMRSPHHFLDSKKTKRLDF